MSLRWRPGPAVVVQVLAFLVVTVMYFANQDMGGDPVTPRGDGQYRPILARGDGHASYLMLRSLVLDGDLDLTNDFRLFNPIWPPTITATGKPATVHPIGPILVWAPVFALAHVGSKVANLFGAGIAAHGYTLWHQRIVFATAPIFTILACWLGFILARRLVGGRWAPPLASAAILLGTSATAYATYVPATSHPPDAAAHALFIVVWALGFGTLRLRRFVLLGALVGLAALIRPSGAGIAVALVVEAAVLLARGAPGGRLRLLVRLAAGGAIVAAVALLTFAPQMIAWKYLYDRWLLTPMGEGYVRLAHPQVVELLFSPRNGWFSTTPLAYAGVVGLAFVPRPARAIAAGMLAVIAVQLLVNAAVYDWWGASAFGARRMVSATAILVVGLAALLAWGSRRARRVPAAARLAVAVALLGWFVAWNLSLVRLLRGGRAAPTAPRPACCADVPPPLAAVARPLYRVVGNPFALPASAVWALRHGRALTDWERGGRYVFEPGWAEYASGAFRRARSGWNFGGPNVAALVSGVGPPQPMPAGIAGAPAQSYRWSTAPRAHLLLPLLHTEPMCFLLRLAPRRAGQTVRVAVNGETLVERALADGWNDILVGVPRTTVGDNAVDVFSELGPPAGPLPAPPGTSQVGVAISRAELSFGACSAPR